MEERKKDHINQAFEARIGVEEADTRFNYEPLLAPHPSEPLPPTLFAGKTLRLPVWVSSMTGGTEQAGNINRNLARACKEFGMGMGLGSCRILLDDDRHFSDFDVRDIIGEEQPLYANLGIAQLEQLLKSDRVAEIEALVKRLRADGLIIHVNPLQEAFQPEGDRLENAPLETLEAFLAQTRLKVIVKEVGQGMGPESLRALLNLPLEAIEFGALGGTNFTRLELARHSANDTQLMEDFAKVGHTAEEMTATVNRLIEEEVHPACRHLIISGGIQSALQGYRLTKLSHLPAIFGMGSGFLKHASGDYKTLQAYVQQIEKVLLLANQYLRAK